MSFSLPTPQEEELMKAIGNAVYAADLERRHWWVKALDLPCFAVLALAQVVQRRWREWRGE